MVLAWNENEAYDWIINNLKIEKIPPHRRPKDNLIVGAPYFAPLDPLEARICTTVDDLRGRHFEDIISLVPDMTELYICADILRDISHPIMKDERLKLAKREIRQHQVNLVQAPPEYHRMQDLYYDEEQARRMANLASAFNSWEPKWKL